VGGRDVRQAAGTNMQRPDGRTYSPHEVFCVLFPKERLNRNEGEILRPN